MALSVSIDINIIGNINRALGTIGKNIDKLTKKVDKASFRFANLGKNLDRIGSKARSVGRGLSLGLTLPIVGLGIASVKAASDAEETLNKFNVVFQDVSKQANSTANDLAQSYGLSQNASKELLANTGDLLTGFGFTGKSALALSGQVQRLAVDLASFTNFAGGAEGASAALTKALLGERESIKSLGIAILEEDVKAKVKALEVTGRFTDETERERKAIATLAIAVEQSKNAIGDFARSSDSTANKTRILLARLNDLAVQFGRILLPIVSQMVSILTKMADRFSKLPTGMKKVIIAIAAMAAVIGPLIFIGGSLLSFISTMITILPILSAVISGTLIPTIVGLATALFATGIPEIIIGISALIAIIVLLARNFKSIKSFIINAFRPALGFVDRLIAKMESISPILGKIGRAFKTVILGNLKLIIAPVEFLANSLNSIIDAINPLGGGGGPSAQADPAQGSVPSITQQAAQVNNQANITIGIQQDSTGKIKGTTVESKNTRANLKVINTGAMTPIAGFG